jgi:carboxypeptidase A4
MWIDGGIHAREWISPATVTWMMKELIENDADHPELTNGLDWYMLAIVNPDGYYFTSHGNRLWRKTRYLASRSVE